MSIMNKANRSKKQKKTVYIIAFIIILSFLISIVSGAFV